MTYGVNFTMYDERYLKTVRDHHKALSVARRELQSNASDILGASKRAVFAIQRGDSKAADTELGSARKSVGKGKAIVKKESRLLGEGMWRAGLEEYTEAVLYNDAIAGRKIGIVKEVEGDPDTYLGALSDLTGELTRSAVLAATERKVKEVKRLHVLVREAVEFLLTLDLTGSHRQKFDQAKQNLRKIEEIAFNVSLHVEK